MSPEALDLTGHTYGRLTVLRRVANQLAASGRSWSAHLCRCECGNEKIVKSHNLRSGHTRTCGTCSSARKLKKSLTGKKIGDLTVLERVANVRSGKRSVVQYSCICSCGRRRLALAVNLRNGSAHICGRDHGERG